MSGPFGSLQISLENGKPVLIGEAPRFVLLHEDLLSEQGVPGLWVSGSNVMFDLEPEPLRYVVIGRSDSDPQSWMAERVEEFPS